MKEESKYLFIVNPQAGKGKSLSILEELKNSLRTLEYNSKIILTEHKRHATKIAKDLQHEYNNIIAVGGDGTLNEVVNGLNLSFNTFLGLLPVGSGNDFSASLKQSKKIRENLQIILNSPDKSHYKSLRLGNISFFENESNIEQNHKFINALGLGFDAMVAHYNEQNKTFKGIISYLTAILKALRNYYPLESRTEIGDKLIEGKKLLISVAKGKTSGGGFFLTPTAELFNDDFGICIIDFVKRAKLLRSLPLAIINKIDTLKETFLANHNTIKIILSKPAFIHTDGEVISRNATKLKVRLLKSNIKVIGSGE